MPKVSRPSVDGFSSSFQHLVEQLNYPAKIRHLSFFDKQIHFAIMLDFVKLGPAGTAETFEPKEFINQKLNFSIAAHFVILLEYLVKIGSAVLKISQS